MSLESLLSQLEQSQLIRQSVEAEAAGRGGEVHAGGREMAYEFEHALAQDTAYQSLLRSRRRAVHRRVAECFERLYPERLDEYAGLLARHYAEAGDDARALAYAERAGDSSLRKYALVEAIAHFELGIERAGRLDALDRLSALYSHRGRALELMGRHEQALRNYEQMQAAAQAATGRGQEGGRQMELQALIRQTLVRSTANLLFDPEQAERLAAEALALASALGDSVAEARILWGQVNLYRFTNRNLQARTAGERALDAIRAQIDASPEPASRDVIELQAFLLNDLSHVYTWTGHPDEATVTLRQAAELWRQLDNRAMLTDNLATSSLYFGLFGDIAAARASAAESLAISDTIQNPWGQAYSRSSASIQYWHSGEMGRAIATMLDCIRYGEQGGYLVALVLMRAYLSLTYLDLGAVQQGMETARAGLAVAEQHLQVLVPAVRAVLAHLLLANGEQAAARAAMDGLAGDDSDNPFGVDRVLDAKAEVSLAFGEVEEALAASRKHIAYLQGHRFRQLLPRALHAQARIFLAAGQTEEAAATLTEAQAIAAALQVRSAAWRILATLADLEAAAGNQAQADIWRAQAREQVAFIAGQIDSDDLRRSFLALPEVQGLMHNEL